MDQYEVSPHTAGWTLERRVQFLRCLADKGDVRRACAQVGLSRQSVYKLRRRDAEFAEIWDAALDVARDARIERLLASLPGATRCVAPTGKATPERDFRESEGDGGGALDGRKGAENRGFPARLTDHRTPHFVSGVR